MLSQVTESGAAAVTASQLKQVGDGTTGATLPTDPELIAKARELGLTDEQMKVVNFGSHTVQVIDDTLIAMPGWTLEQAYEAYKGLNRVQAQVACAKAKKAYDAMESCNKLQASLQPLNRTSDNACDLWPQEDDDYSDAPCVD